MLSKSLSAMVSAIEIYNKPDFKYREENFIVLAVNAWELLFKAKILADNKNKLKSIYVYHDNGRIKRTRSKNPMTVELIGSMRLLKLEQAVVDNIISMVEIRDTAIHFFHKAQIKYVVFTLGVATLQNYQSIVKDWFGVSLKDYNFYIMPLSFVYDFTTIKSLGLENSPPVVANIIRSVSEMQNADSQNSNYRFVCEIGAELFSVKKSSQDADLTIKIDQNAEGAELAVTSYKSKLDRYPFSYTQVIGKIKESLPSVKQGQIDIVIRMFSVKNNQALSAFSFRNKTQDTEYQKTGKVPAGIPSIYNQSAIDFILSKLK